MLSSAFITTVLLTLFIYTTGILSPLLISIFLYIAYEPFPIKIIPNAIITIAKNFTMLFIAIGPFPLFSPT